MRVPARLSPARLTAALHRSEEHTSELQSQSNLVCRLLLEKKNKRRRQTVRDLHIPRISRSTLLPPYLKRGSRRPPTRRRPVAMPLLTEARPPNSARRSRAR